MLNFVNLEYILQVRLELRVFGSSQLIVIPNFALMLYADTRKHQFCFLSNFQGLNNNLSSFLFITYVDVIPN